MSELTLWVAGLAVASLAGWVLDWVLATDVRQSERRRVQRFFEVLFDQVDKAKPLELQILVADRAVGLLQSCLPARGKKLRLLSLFVFSQYLTFGAFLTAELIWGNPIPWVEGKVIAHLVPLAPYLGLRSWLAGLPSEIALAHVGLYWYNLVFDGMTVFVTFHLLRFVTWKQRGFALAAAFDVAASYVLAYCCVALYKLTPPGSVAVPGLFTFLPTMFAGNIPEKGLACYSLTTFVPVTLFMVLLLFLSVAKAVHWTLAPILYDLATNEEETVFFRLASASTLTAGIVRAIIKLLGTGS